MPAFAPPERPLLSLSLESLDEGVISGLDLALVVVVGGAVIGRVREAALVDVEVEGALVLVEVRRRRISLSVEAWATWITSAYTVFVTDCGSTVMRAGF